MAKHIWKTIKCETCKKVYSGGYSKKYCSAQCMSNRKK